MSVLCIENLVKSYAGKKLAADGISFTVEAGEIFGLLGKNGAGKSTMLNAVAGVWRVRRGGGSAGGKEAYWLCAGQSRLL